MKVIGLFAGLGGFELAFSRLGFETIFLAENDPAARLVLSEQFPETELRSDVLQLERLPTGAEVLCAGFPCQNLSMAGDKSGIRGPKSSVIEHLFHLLEGVRVPVVIIENVYFMLHLERGRAMNYLLESFEKLNYKWAYRVLDTLAFGLPQRRRRVYLVASLDCDPRDVLLADDAGALSHEKPTLDRPIGFYWTEGRSGVGFAADAIPPLKGGSSIGIPSPPAVLFPDGFLGTPPIGIAEQLQGFPSGWSGSACAVRERLRWKLIGNAVSIPVAEWIANKLLHHASGGFDALAAPITEERWPAAAFNVGQGRHSVSASSAPNTPPKTSIASFRCGSPWNDLSPRATRGFLKRAREGNLRFPEGFLEATAKWIGE